MRRLLFIAFPLLLPANGPTTRIDWPSVLVIVADGRPGDTTLDVDWVPAEARPPRKIARKEAFAPEDLHPPATVRRVRGGLLAVQTFLGGGAHAESVVRVKVGSSSVF